MKNPKQVCLEHGIYAHIGIQGAQVMAKHIREAVDIIISTPSTKTTSERLKEYFDIKD